MPVSDSTKTGGRTGHGAGARGGRFRGDPSEALDGMCRNVLALLSALPGPPRRIAVHLDPPGLEIEWAAAPAAAAASAPAAAEGGGAPVPHGAPAPPTPEGGTSQGGGAAAQGRQDAPASSGDVLVEAANVGTFYRRPEPSAPPFAEVGCHVEEGDQLAIVEAMKLMIPVEAPVAGTVTAVHADDGAAVEYGQPLLSIRPDTAPAG